MPRILTDLNRAIAMASRNWNYPPGDLYSDHEKGDDCEECDGDGEITNESGRKVACPDCGGTGTVGSTRGKNG